MTYNSDNFDLSLWRATLPVDADGGTDGKALTIKDLTDFEHSEFFYDADDGAMVFYSTVDGARTSANTKYTRTELREANEEGLAAEWTIEESSTLTATLRMDEVPVSYKDKWGGVVVGQIHGSKDELVRLYYDKGELYFVNEHSMEDGKEHRFDLYNDAGETPDVDLGEIYSYKIQVTGGDTLVVEVMADGETYSSVTPIDAFWMDDTFYYKAGLYLANNEDNGAGAGQVSFYGLDVSHVEGEGLGGIVVPGEEKVEVAEVIPPVEEVIPPVEEVIPPVEEVIPPVEEVIPPVEEVIPPVIIDDTFSFAEASWRVRVDLLDETQNAGEGIGVDYTDIDNLIGSAHTDNLKGNKNDNIIDGGDSRDFLYGRYGEDTLYGGEGRDKIQGQSGDDALFGGTEGDQLDGGTGNDVLDGGAGRDVLFGGEGADIFVFGDKTESTQHQNYDQISDFEVGVDLIDLSALGFIGLDDGGGATEDGELRLTHSAATDRTYVRSDQDDFEFYLQGDYTDTLSNDDFLF